MRFLSSADILRVWEFGQGKSLVEQALILLAPAFPELSRQELYDLPIGNRDLRLLELRRLLAGERLTGKSSCPNCDAELQFSLTLSQLIMNDYRKLGTNEYTEEIEGYQIRFRALTSQDQLNVAHLYDIEEAAESLRRASLIEARWQDQPVDPASLPDSVFDAMGERLIDLDPQVETRFALNCAVCSTRFSAVFEAVEFVWCEIAAHATHTLEEVVLLARAFGWAERDILEMTPRRRQRYLDMVPSS